MIRKIVDKLRGRVSLEEELYSLELRQKFSARGIHIGLYSYGCFDFGRVFSGTTIGRYCSFAPTVRVQTRNHAMSYLTMHPILYDPGLGGVASDNIPVQQIVIGDGAWVAANAVILPSVRSIGRGAVIGAGAIVTRDVPPYAVVAGNPARVLRMRFDQETIDAIEGTKWWDKPIEEMRELIRTNHKMLYEPADYFAKAASDGGRYLENQRQGQA